MSSVLRNEINTGHRTRFARSTKTYTTFTSCQNAEVDYALEGSMF